jgi:hypothetical protein
VKLSIETAGRATFVLILMVLAGTFAFVVWAALDKAGQ